MAVSIGNIVKNIRPVARKIAGRPLGIASKAIGAATIASAVYDAHVNGAERADTYDSKATANRMYNQNHLYNTMNKKSATIAQFKKYWYDFNQCSSYSHLKNRAVGYFGEFGSTIAANAVNLALAGVALKFKRAGKVAGVLLALNAAKTFVFDVAGVGAKKEKI